MDFSTWMMGLAFFCAAGLLAMPSGALRKRLRPLVSAAGAVLVVLAAVYLVSGLFGAAASVFSPSELLREAGGTIGIIG
ncbi:MAG: hypothetical protein KH354_03120 [Clostridiales bacterium]|nr:hypothetical protein [Clostridiales bacterium]